MKKIDFSEATNKLSSVIGKNKYVMIVILVGLILILLPRGKSDKAESVPVSDSTVAFSLSDEESRISSALSAVDGAGNVRVILTLRSGTERILAEDTEESVRSDGAVTERSVTTVIVSAGASCDEPVTKKYIYPEYMGALVIAEGADIPSVKLGLTESVAGLTGLPTAKISVVKMAGNSPS